MIHRILASVVALVCGAAALACSEPRTSTAVEKDTVRATSTPPATDANGVQAPAKLYKTATEVYGPLSVQEGTVSAEASITPWSSYWFPFRDDFLFAPRSGQGSPLQRHDAYTARALGWSTTATTYEHDHLYDNQAESWAGRCGAWALASILAPEPRTPLTRNGVYFRVSDQKGLLIETFDQVTGLTQIGVRYEGRWDDDYADIYPNDFHRVLQAELIQGKRPIIIDSDAGIEVWHQPLYKVTTTIQRDSSRGDLVHVSTFVTGASAHVADIDFTGTLDEKREYTYDLHGSWSHGSFDVTSGEWTDRSRWDHPDYVILMPQTVQRSSTNPEVVVSAVDQILGG
jgi:hypothetical protein